MAAASSPVALLAHLKKLEAAGKPIYPIPLFDLRRHLENFQKRGVPRGGFGSNSPSQGAAGAAILAKQQLAAQTGSVSARRRFGVGSQGGGTFGAEHFQVGLPDRIVIESMGNGQTRNGRRGRRRKQRMRKDWSFFFFWGGGLWCCMSGRGMC